MSTPEINIVVEEIVYTGEDAKNKKWIEPAKREAMRLVRNDALAIAKRAGIEDKVTHGLELLVAGEGDVSHVGLWVADDDSAAGLILSMAVGTISEDNLAADALASTLTRAVIVSPKLSVDIAKAAAVTLADLGMFNGAELRESKKVQLDGHHVIKQILAALTGEPEVKQVSDSSSGSAKH